MLKLKEARPSLGIADAISSPYFYLSFPKSDTRVEKLYFDTLQRHFAIHILTNLWFLKCIIRINFAAAPSIIRRPMKHYLRISEVKWQWKIEHYHFAIYLLRFSIHWNILIRSYCSHVKMRRKWNLQELHNTIYNFNLQIV